MEANTPLGKCFSAIHVSQELLCLKKGGFSYNSKEQLSKYTEQSPSLEESKERVDVAVLWFGWQGGDFILDVFSSLNGSTNGIAYLQTITTLANLKL